MCDVCGVRPAVTAVRRIVPGELSRTEHFCELHAAQARGGGRSSPFGGGGSLFDDFFNRFFDDASEDPRRIPIGGGRSAPRGRQAEQVDITQFFSDSTSDLLQLAAQQAVEWGSLDLGTEHLLWAALEDDVARRVLEEVDADPSSIKVQLEEEAGKGARTDVSPSLAPDAKRAAFGLRGVAGPWCLLHRARACSARAGPRRGVRGRASLEALRTVAHQA